MTMIKRGRNQRRTREESNLQILLEVSKLTSRSNATPIGPLVLLIVMMKFPTCKSVQEGKRKKEEEEEEGIKQEKPFQKDKNTYIPTNLPTHPYIRTYAHT